MQRIAVAVAVLAAGLLVVPAVKAQQDWGNIKGRLVWAPEKIPVQTPIDIGKSPDKAHCMVNGKPVLSEQWVVNQKDRGVHWALVWLINDNPKDKTPLPINPKLEKPGANPSVDQPACAFIPHVIGMRQGQELIVKNSSKITHNVKWTSKDNNGNVTVPPGAEFKIKDLQAQRLPMTIECNIHPWMKGYVGIFAHPYFAVTDANGNFEIQGAPAGKYRLVVWDNGYNGGAPGRLGQQITIAPGTTTNLGELKFTPPPE